MSGNGEAFKFLANGFLYPEDVEFLESGWNVLQGLSQDLGVLFQVPDGPSNLHELQSEYVRLFVSSSTGELAPPYASCYLSRSRLLHQEPAREALDYYREVGIEPESSIEPPDHLATELAFVAHLLELGHHSLLMRFAEHHLLKWFPLFLTRLLGLRPLPWYRHLGLITGAMLEKINEKGGV